MSNKPLCGAILDFPNGHHTCDEVLGHYPTTPHVSRGESLGEPYEISWGKGMFCLDYKDWDSAEIPERKTNI